MVASSPGKNCKGQCGKIGSFLRTAYEGNLRGGISGPRTVKTIRETMPVPASAAAHLADTNFSD